MAATRAGIRTLVRNALVLFPIAAVAGLAMLDPFQDVLGNLLKPAVAWILSSVGIAAEDAGNALVIGALHVPWSGDCAGTNHLVLLLALVIWMRRRALWSRRTLLACILVIPAALAANIGRILSLIGVRAALHPSTESPELHYFIGFLWLLPFAAVLIPPGHRKRFSTWIELAHSVVIFSLLAPLLGASESLGMGAAAVLLLARGRVPTRWTGALLAAMAGWLIAGATIAILGMESFWLPWLLTSPLIAPALWFRQPRTLLLIACSHPLFDWLPGGAWITWAAVGWSAWIDFLRAPPAMEAPRPDPAPSAAIGKPLPAALIALNLLALPSPFAASLLLVRDPRIPDPPAEATVYTVPGQGFEIVMPGQPEGFGIFWYPPGGNDRHHSLPVCMLYSGVRLRAVGGGGPGFWSTEDLWYREFFLQDGALIDRHLDYVAATLGAWASPGIHLVFVARKSHVPFEKFRAQSEAFAALIRESTVGSRRSDS
jgi:exosortase/archaeosortase family protein